MTVRSDVLFAGAISDTTGDVATVPAGERWLLKDVHIHGYGERVLIELRRPSHEEIVRLVDETPGIDVCVAKVGWFVVIEATWTIYARSPGGGGNTHVGLFGAKLVL